MIEKLVDAADVVDKINEIIDVLNGLEKKPNRINPYDKNAVKSTYNKPKIRKQNK